MSPNKMTVCPAKTQISLGIHPVWSESSLSAQWVAQDPSFLHSDSEDSDQTRRMPRLIGVFASAHAILLVSSWGGSIMFWQLCQYWFVHTEMGVAVCDSKESKWHTCNLKICVGWYIPKKNVWLFDYKNRIFCVKAAVRIVLNSNLKFQNTKNFRFCSFCHNSSVESGVL